MDLRVQEKIRSWIFGPTDGLKGAGKYSNYERIDARLQKWFRFEFLAQQMDLKAQKDIEILKCQKNDNLWPKKNERWRLILLWMRR